MSIEGGWQTLAAWNAAQPAVRCIGWLDVWVTVVLAMWSAGLMIRCWKLEVERWASGSWSVMVAAMLLEMWMAHYWRERYCRDTERLRMQPTRATSERRESSCIPNAMPSFFLGGEPTRILRLDNPSGSVAAASRMTATPCCYTHAAASTSNELKLSRA
jgi:hypothetical protein